MLLSKSTIFLIALSLIPLLSFSQDSDQYSFFEQKKALQDSICSNAEALIQQDHCAEAMDYLLSENVTESDLVDPVKLHLLLLESQVCSDAISDVDGFNERLNQIEQSYQLDESDKEKIQTIRHQLEQQSRITIFQKLGVFSWPVFSFVLLILLASIFRRRQRS